MPSIPNVPFSAGDVWTPELAYLALTKPNFGGDTTVFGNWSKIKDSELDDAATSLKGMFSSFTTSHTVTKLNSTQVLISAGTSLIAGGLITTTSPTTLTVTANGYTFVYINRLGFPEAAQILPVYSRVIGIVNATSGVIVEVYSLPRNATSVQPRTDAIKVHGGTSTIDFTAGNGQTINGLIYCRDFLVPAGVTLNVKRTAKVLCRNFTVTGTITISPAAPGGRGAFGNPNFALYLGKEGQGLGGGSGGNSPVSQSYSWLEQPYGSGGGSATASVTTASGLLQIGNGGDGGGGLYVESNGVVSITGSIFANGGSAQASSVSSGSPVATVSGASGGSGGTVTISSINSINLSVSSTIQVKGGAGQPGIQVGGSTLTPSSGVPGAGGQVTLISPTIVSAGTVDVSTPSYTPQLGQLGGSNSGANGGNGGGVINVVNNPPQAGIVNLIYENPLGI